MSATDYKARVQKKRETDALNAPTGPIDPWRPRRHLNIEAGKRRAKIAAYLLTLEEPQTALQIARGAKVDVQLVGSDLAALKASGRAHLTGRSKQSRWSAPPQAPKL